MENSNIQVNIHLITYRRGAPYPLDVLTWLNNNEQLHLNRLISNQKREQFLFSRLFVRRILGDLLGCNPAAVNFSREATGRPFLPQSPEIHFSLSHTNGCIALIVASHIVGVDIENISQRPFPLAIIKQFFTVRERIFLSKLCPSKRSLFAFNIWTRKEAIAKADGNGLALNLRDIDTLPADAWDLNHSVTVNDASWFVSSHNQLNNCIYSVANQIPVAMPSPILHTWETYWQGPNKLHQVGLMRATVTI